MSLTESQIKIYTTFDEMPIFSDGAKGLALI